MKANRTLLALFLATTAGLAAQDAPAPAPTPAAAPAPPADTTPANPLAPVSPAASAPALNVSLPADTASVAAVDASGAATNVMHVAKFPNEDIRTILTSVATLFNLNVIIPDTLSGTTTLQLHDVTWQQIFKYVLDPIGYTYTLDGSGPNAVILIKNKTDIAAEPMETIVHPVVSAKADDLAKSLVQFIDTTSKPPETIIPDVRTNSLIITAHPAKMSGILDAIDRLDKQTQQVLIETKFIEVDAKDEKDLGIDWNFNGTPLVSSAYAYQYSVFEGLPALYTSGALPSTFPEQNVTGNVANTPSTNLNILQTPSSIGGNLPVAPRKALSLAFFNQAQYNAVLEALQTSSDTKLVSNPTAVTMDNTEITMGSATNITMVFPTINNQSGVSQPGNTTTLTVGITIKIKPHVTNNGFINLTLNPVFSTLNGQSDTYFGASYPEVVTRSLTDAQVSVKDGFTLAIGGLIDDQDIKSTSGVPILADIPIIGNLFKSNQTTHQRDNLIIFVTARTLPIDGNGYLDSVDPELMLRSGVTADQVPGYYNTNRSADTPGMTYPSADQAKAMDQVQKLRDQAAALEKMQEYQDQIQQARSLAKQPAASPPAAPPPLPPQTPSSPVPTTGTGIVTVAWADSALTASYGYNYDQVVAATGKAIEQLQFAQPGQQKDALSTAFSMHNARGDLINIVVTHTGDNAANVVIRVGTAGDEMISEAINDKIKANL
jgi:type IV pilus assembly protein PilQ